MEGKENLTAQIETQIEQSPTPVQTAQKATGQKSNPVVTEARQLIDKNPKNNEFSNKALKGKSIEELLAMRDRLGPEPSVSRPVQEYETFDSPTAYDRYDSHYIDPSRTSREQWESLDDNDRPFVQALRDARSMYGTANEMAEDPEELQRHREKIANEAAELYRDYYSKDRYQEGVDQFIEKNRKAEESTNKHADWSRKSKAIARALKAAGYIEEQPKPDIPEEDDWQLQGARDNIAALIPGISAEDIDRAIQELSTGRADDGSFIMKPEYEDISEDEIRNKLIGMLGARNGSSINGNTNENTTGVTQMPETSNTGIERNQEGQSVPNGAPKPGSSLLERLVETKPEVVKEAVPENNPIHEEAEQVTDGDERTTEANNTKVEEGIKQGGIDWDKLEKNWYTERENLNKPQEDLKDEFGQTLSDFSPEENEVINEALSEDFNTVDDLYNYLEDVYDPGLEDQNQYQEAVDNVPDPDETIYDQSMASQPVIPEEKLEPAPEAPYADNVAQIKEDEVDQLQEDIAPETVEEEKRLSIPNISIGGNAPINPIMGGVGSGSSIPSENPKLAGGSFIRNLPNLIASKGNSYSTPSTSGGSKTVSGTPNSESLKKGTVASNIQDMSSGKSSVPVKGSLNSGERTLNGATVTSGPTNKASRSLKYDPTKLPSGEERMESYDVEGQTGGSSGGNEATLNNIESRVKSIQPWTLAEQLGFSAKYKHVAYNGTSIDQLSPEQIREVLKILDTLGV